MTLPGSGSGERRARRTPAPRSRRPSPLLVIVAVGMLGAAGVAALVLAGTRGGHRPRRRSPDHPPARPSGPDFIRQENAKPGTSDWVINGDDVAHRPIEGFADHVSGQRGDTVRLFATTSSPSFHVEAYRMGWYAGKGGRLIWRSNPVAGVQQPACPVTPGVLTVDCANWAPSLSIRVGRDWPPGEYLFKMVTSSGGAGYVPYTVRDDSSHAAIVVINAVTTWQAYNAWGGHSLYGDENGRAAERADIVSFDRPYLIGWNGTGHFFGGTYPAVQLLESQGLDVTYTTSVDEHEHPELLRNHRLVLSMSHDEYYSTPMRSGMEAARDHGTNLMFLGANAVYRRIRFQPSPLGPDRLQVNYRVAANDPFNGKDPANVTTSWRDPPAPNPESSLLGELYQCNPVQAPLVVSDPTGWPFTGTGIRAGEQFPDVVGNEYDQVDLSFPTPPNIEVLAHSPVTCGGKPGHSDMTYYTAPSGAGVFDSGTLYLEPRLGELCAATDQSGDCQLRRLVDNLVTTLMAGPAGKVHPSQNNLAKYGIG